MTAEEKIKREILLQAQKGLYSEPIKESEITAENVNERYDNFRETDLHWDYESEFRCGAYETDIDAGSSRNYELRSVASKLSDGSWVGWTYVDGGGKHACPEDIPWMNEAYELDCTEHEETVIVRDFQKLSEQVAT